MKSGDFNVKGIYGVGIGTNLNETEIYKLFEEPIIVCKVLFVKTNFFWKPKWKDWCKFEFKDGKRIKMF